MKKCTHTEEVDFTDSIILCQYMAGMSDMKLKKDLLSKANITLAEAERMAVNKESAAFCQSSVVGDRQGSSCPIQSGEASAVESSCFRSQPNVQQNSPIVRPIAQQTPGAISNMPQYSSSVVVYYGEPLLTPQSSDLVQPRMFS